jgi:hypothetical protein
VFYVLEKNLHELLRIEFVCFIGRLVMSSINKCKFDSNYIYQLKL